jgi:hypothetical protein
VSGRATFGEFLHAARRFTEPEEVGGRVTGRHDIVGVSHSLARIVATMSRYVDDVMATYPRLPSATRSAEAAWALAASQAQEALINAARLLPPQQGSGRPASSPASDLGRRLEATAVSLTAGRDLLQTHLAVRADGVQQQRSEWAAVITSPAATRALLMEIAVIARRIAPQVTDLALSASASGPGTGQARRRLNAACQSLWALHSSVQTARRQRPASPAGRELLCAIPVNSLPPRRVPDGTESVAALCDGAVTSAERVRQLAWGQAERAAWSREVSAASLHQVAAASAVTSHNCHVVLQTLTTGISGRKSDRLRTELAEAAAAANHARQAWRRVAGALDQVVTDGRGHVSPVAVETRDLAIWTGRLAYAEPGWTPSRGPRREIQPPGSLMPTPQQVPLVVAAVHHACHTLTRLAWAQEGVIRTAAQAGRILITTRSLPDDFDIPHPYTRAPREHIDRLLSGYRVAGHASHRAAIAVAEVAQATGASSRILAAAMATELGQDHDEMPRCAMNSRTPAARRLRALDLIGPVECALVDLGVTRPDLRRRAAELDRDSERLIVDAAVDRELAGKWPGVVERNTSAATAALVDHALASGDPRATTILQPYLRGREPPEAEP